MRNTYNEPEFKIVNMTNEDILTKSTLDPFSSGFETGNNTLPGDMIPIIDLE